MTRVITCRLLNGISDIQKFWLPLGHIRSNETDAQNDLSPRQHCHGITGSTGLLLCCHILLYAMHVSSPFLVSQYTAASRFHCFNVFDNGTIHITVLVTVRYIFAPAPNTQTCTTKLHIVSLRSLSQNDTFSVQQTRKVDLAFESYFHAIRAD